MNTGFLVLAAGQSRRFGTDDKLLAPFDGKPVIAHVLDALQQAAPTAPTRVCLSPQNDNDLSENALARYLQSRRQAVLVCPNAQLGMGSTLADAVAACGDWAGWVICLADMPHIKARTYEQVLRTPAPGGILAPHWQTQRGHPVRFDQKWRNSLCELRGDTGARALLDRFNDQLTRLSVDDPGITLDIDTPSDLNRRLMRHYDASSGLAATQDRPA